MILTYLLCLKVFALELKNQFGVSIRALNSDNAKQGHISTMCAHTLSIPFDCMIVDNLCILNAFIS